MAYSSSKIFGTSAGTHGCECQAGFPEANSSIRSCKWIATVVAADDAAVWQRRLQLALEAGTLRAYEVAFEVGHKTEKPHPHFHLYIKTAQKQRGRSFLRKLLRRDAFVAKCMDEVAYRHYIRKAQGSSLSPEDELLLPENSCRFLSEGELPTVVSSQRVGTQPAQRQTVNVTWPLNVEPEATQDSEATQETLEASRVGNADTTEEASQEWIPNVVEGAASPRPCVRSRDSQYAVQGGKRKRGINGNSLPRMSRRAILVEAMRVAKSTEEALRFVKEKDPLTWATCFNTWKKPLDSHYNYLAQQQRLKEIEAGRSRKPRLHYGVEDYNTTLARNLMISWERAKSNDRPLWIEGKAGCGKTAWVMAVLGSRVARLTDTRNVEVFSWWNHSYLWADDVNWSRFDIEEVKMFFDRCSLPRIFGIRFKNLAIPEGVLDGIIATSNKALAAYFPTARVADLEAIERRVDTFHVESPLFTTPETDAAVSHDRTMTLTASLEQIRHEAPDEEEEPFPGN